MILLVYVHLLLEFNWSIVAVCDKCTCYFILFCVSCLSDVSFDVLSNYLQLTTTFEVPEIPRPSPEEVPIIVPEEEEEEEEEVVAEIPAQGTPFLLESCQRALLSSLKDLHLYWLF